MKRPSPNRIRRDWQPYRWVNYKTNITIPWLKLMQWLWALDNQKTKQIRRQYHNRVVSLGQHTGRETAEHQVKISNSSILKILNKKNSSWKNNSTNWVKIKDCLLLKQDIQELQTTVQECQQQQQFNSPLLLREQIVSEMFQLGWHMAVRRLQDKDRDILFELILLKIIINKKINQNNKVQLEMLIFLGVLKE